MSSEKRKRRILPMDDFLREAFEEYVIDHCCPKCFKNFGENDYLAIQRRYREKKNAASDARQKGRESLKPGYRR